MDKLTEPLKSIEDFYSDLIASKRNNQDNDFLKDRLDGIKVLLKNKEIEYIKMARSSELYKSDEHTQIEVPNSSKIVTKNEMESLYMQDFVSKAGSGKIGRETYDYLKSLALDNTCPYCSISKVKTLDHYLPKSKFPTYAITPVNLVPCCRDCNTEKDDNFSNDEKQMFIHPYFEFVNNFQWLKCEVLDNTWPISFKFEIIISNDNNMTLSQRLFYQHELLDLNSTYSNMANRRFINRLKSIIENYKTGGIHSVREFLKESEQSCRSAEFNSFEACMYNALLNSQWFFSSALRQLEEKYKDRINL